MTINLIKLDPEKEHGMTVARELAEFLTETSVTDLPPQAIEQAAMLIASTLASAAMGSGLASSAIIRSLARERGGISEASLWFDTGPKLPAAEAAQVNAVMSDAAASDDSDLRNIVHAGTTLVATTLAIAERTGAGGDQILTSIVLGYEAAGRIGEAITPGFRATRIPRLPRCDFCWCGGRGAVAAAGSGSPGPGHSLVGDLDRRADGRGQYQRRL